MLVTAWRRGFAIMRQSGQAGCMCASRRSPPNAPMGSAMRSKAGEVHACGVPLCCSLEVVCQLLRLLQKWATDSQEQHALALHSKLCPTGCYILQEMLRQQACQAR